MIDDTLYDAFGQRQVSIIFTQSNQYRVVLESLPTLQDGPGGLKNIYIKSALVNSGASSASNPTIVANASSTNAVTTSNSLYTQNNSSSSKNSALLTNNTNGVALSAIRPFLKPLGPLVINRQGQFPVATISFNLAPDAALGDADTGN